MEVTVAAKLYGYFFFSEIRSINVMSSMRSRLNENNSCHVTILTPPSLVLTKTIFLGEIAYQLSDNRLSYYYQKVKFPYLRLSTFDSQIYYFFILFRIISYFSSTFVHAYPFSSTLAHFWLFFTTLVHFAHKKRLTTEKP